MEAVVERPKTPGCGPGWLTPRRGFDSHLSPQILPTWPSGDGSGFVSRHPTAEVRVLPSAPSFLWSWSSPARRLVANEETAGSTPADHTNRARSFGEHLSLVRTGRVVQLHLRAPWRFRLSARIPGLHPGEGGSAPPSATNWQTSRVTMADVSYPSDENRAYLKRRYSVQRRFFIQILGGKCARCGTEQKLQIDHRDPAKKTMHLGRLFTKNTISEALRELLDKCQALCGPCHRKKSAEEARQRPRYFTHGTVYGWMKVGCRCDICLAAKGRWLDRRNKARRGV